MIEEKLRSLNIALPNAPKPVGSYIPVTIAGNLVFVSGQIPVDSSKRPPVVLFAGKVGKDISLEQARQAAKLCIINALAQLRSYVDLEMIKKIVKVTGYVNCDTDFTEHPNVINGASEFLVEIFGEKGRHSRVAVGVNSLPLNSAVEVDVIVHIE